MKSSSATRGGPHACSPAPGTRSRSVLGGWCPSISHEPAGTCCAIAGGSWSRRASGGCRPRGPAARAASCPSADRQTVGGRSGGTYEDRYEGDGTTCRPRMVGPMRIATWNVNSVQQRLPRLLPWLDERRPDVVCLQETKLADDAFAELLGEELAERGYAVAAHGQGAVERRGDPLAGRPRRRRRPASPGAPGWAGPGGAGRRRDLRRRARRTRVYVPNGRDARLRPLPLQARVAGGAARRGRGRAGGRDRARRHEHRAGRRGRLRSRTRTSARRTSRRRSGRRSPRCCRSGCTTWCASAGRRSGSSPTGTTAPACSTRTSACGSTWCSRRRRSPRG